MYKLYIDFDGVIWDTWPALYQVLSDTNHELYEKLINKLTTNEDDLNIGQIFKTMDWEIVLRNTLPLNDSIKYIKELQATGLFDITILTHCNTQNEVTNKHILIDNLLPGVEVIAVFKPNSKASAVDPRGAILVDDFGGNLAEWDAAGGIAVKFSTKPDKNYSFYHINNLSQIMDVIEAIKQQEVETNQPKLVKLSMQNGY